MPCSSSRSAGRRGPPTSGRSSPTCCAAGASSPERVEEVAHHYELFGGVSPITELTLRQADGLARGARGARHAAAGVRRHAQLGSVPARHAGADVARRRAPGGRRHRGGASQLFELHAIPRERRRGAARAARATGSPDVRGHLRRATGTCTHGFIDGERGARARPRWSGCRPTAARARELVFTAHSIPVSMAQRYPYQAQLEASCLAVATEIARRARRAQHPTWRWCTRAAADGLKIPGSGRTSATTCARRRRAASPASCSAPIGFVCDHIEVLYDLDIEAAAGVPRTRPADGARAAVNDHPRFVDAMADAVARPWQRYAHGRALPIVRWPHEDRDWPAVAVAVAVHRLRALAAARRPQHRRHAKGSPRSPASRSGTTRSRERPTGCTVILTEGAPSPASTSAAPRQARVKPICSIPAISSTRSTPSSSRAAAPWTRWRPAA